MGPIEDGSEGIEVECGCGEWMGKGELAERKKNLSEGQNIVEAFDRNRTVAIGIEEK
jgi:hypothetical protein